MTKPLRDLVGRWEDREPFIYLDKCHVHRKDLAIVAVNEEGEIQIPAAQIGVLMLGPGTSATQPALQALGECGCPVAWTGMNGVRLYSFSQPLSGSTVRLERQARLWVDPVRRREAARHWLELRFGEPIPGQTLDEIRGQEGLRMATAYARAAETRGRAWSGRQTDRPWEEQDDLNRALSIAMASLYAVAGAAVLGMGLAPGLGLLHGGDPFSFVYDVADRFRLSLAVPVAFDHAAEGEGAVRAAMGETLREDQTMRQMLHLLDGLGQGAAA